MRKISIQRRAKVRGRAVRDLLLVAGTLLIAGAGVGSLAQPEPTSEAQEVAEAWLRIDCANGEAGIDPSVLERLAEELEPLFLGALDLGPPEELEAEVLEVAELRWKARVELLESEASLGLSEADRAEAASATREEYLDRALGGLRASYRSQATLGLGFVGTRKSLAPLRAVAEDDSSPIQAVAIRALGRLQQRLGSLPL